MMPCHILFKARNGLFLLLLATMFATGCGGGKTGETLPAAAPQGNFAVPASQPVDEVITEIQTVTAPPGISESVFAELQAELIRSLEERETTHILSAAPHGDENVVCDLFLFGDETAGFSLQWTYCNNGDYNLDGLVGISDLTTVGQNYEESIYGGNWAKARHADGNNDGLVTVSDITPIGQKYNTFVAGYNIYAAMTKDGARELIYSMPKSEFPAETFFDITYDINAGDAVNNFFWVIPFDGKGSEGVCSVVSRPTGDPAEVNLGSDTVVLTEAIGEDGGDFAGPAGTALEGMTFRFKPGTVPSGTVLYLGENDGTIEPVAGEFGGSIITMETPGVREFGELVEITVPYPRQDWSMMYVPYSVAEDGSLAVLNLLEHNKEMGYAKFTAMHPLKFAWMKVLIENMPPGLWLTTYQPGIDGFQVYNFGSVFSPGGQCAGMSFFSRWYWIHCAQNSGGFYQKYMYDVGSNYAGQNIVAIRAHTSLNRVYGQTKAMYLWYEDTATDEQNYLAVCNSLRNSGRPVVIGLTKTTGPGGHAVLSYGYDDGGLWIYDPNTSHVSQYITYNSSSKTFTPYGPFDNIYLAGDDTGVATYESFDSIWHDANYGFTNYGFAEVHVESHADGEIIAAGTTNITGYVASGQLLADTLKMYVDGVCHTRALPEAGWFEFNGIPIHYGTNDIWFQVYGTSQNGQAWIPVESGYRLDLTGSSQPPVFGVTLVWDQANTDMDLYVTDPTGHTSWFGQQSIPDGGFLHSNVTDGYGPEYWELGQYDIVRYGQPYLIRAHYRDGNKTVMAHMGIRRYEGTGWDQYSLTPSWYFTSNHNNTDPAATGNDWKTLASIVLVNHYMSAVDSGPFRVEQGDDGVPVIYIAVP